MINVSLNPNLFLFISGLFLPCEQTETLLLTKGSNYISLEQNKNVPDQAAETHSITFFQNVYTFSWGYLCVYQCVFVSAPVSSIVLCL